MIITVKFNVQGFENQHDFDLQTSKISLSKLLLKIQGEDLNYELPLDSFISLQVENNQFQFSHSDYLKEQQRLASWFKARGIKFDLL